MKIKLYLSTLLLLTFYGMGQAQIKNSANPNHVWYESKFVKHIGDVDTDEGGSFSIENGNGDIYFVGTTDASSSNSADNLLVRKITSNGSLIWEKQFAADFDNQNISMNPSSLTVLQDGNLLIGVTRDFLFKINASNGGLIWTKRLIGESNTDVAKNFANIIPTGSGGFIVARSFQRFVGAANMTGCALIEFDSNGDVLWYKANAFDANDTFEGGVRPRDIKQNPDGTIAVLFERFMIAGGNTGGHQMGIFRAEANGDITNYSFAYNRPGINSFRPTSLAAYGTNMYGILGQYEDDQDLVDGELYYLLVLSNGNIHTQRIYECGEAETTLFGKLTSGNGCRAVGRFGDAGFSVSVGLLGNISPSFYDEAGSEIFFRSVAEAANKRILLTGNRDGDGLLLKTGTPSGVSACDIEKTTCFSVCATSGIEKFDYPFDFSEIQEISTEASQFNITELGSEKPCDRTCYEKGEWREIDIITDIGLDTEPDNETGISRSNPHTDNDRLSSNQFNFYPNPASEYVILNYELSLEETAQLSVYDLLGKEQIGMILPTGENRKVLDVSNLASGVYGVRIYNDEGVLFSGKIVIGKK